MKSCTVLLILGFFIFYISDGSVLSIRIVPGTKWCGKGNDSSSEDDLGVFNNTDNCCRAHDMCPDSIPSESWKHGLYNKDSYTKTHCDCDFQFYDCLKNASTPISLEIGKTYFNILRPQCFKQTYPIKRCARKKHRKCVNYVLDTSKKPIYWQWFDNKSY